MDSPQSGRTMQFQFNGKAGEYFKIWIVNIALSIITLGIYSPWAKVRTKRYFYGNTMLDGSSFDYLADPLAILKGRMLVFAFILMYAVMTEYMPMLVFVFFILYLIALPWMVIKSMQFNTRNSAYRNIRFNFDGKLGEAAFVFIGLSIFSMITLGLATPYAVKRFKQFTVEHSYFGTSKFGFHAGAGSFYWIYFKILVIPLIGILAAIAIPAYNSYIELSKAQLELPQQIEVQEETIQEYIENASSEELGQLEPMQDDQYSDEYTLENNEEMSADEYYQQDSEQDYVTTEYGDDCNPAQPPEQCTQETEPGELDAIGMLVMLLSMAIYLLLIVYIQTRITNLVLNNTSLNAHKLQSTLRVRDMFAIYVTNTIAIIVSLGLLIPWSKIRVTRYRFAHTNFIARGEINEFIANEQKNVSATGGEFTEAFDIDLGF